MNKLLLATASALLASTAALADHTFIMPSVSNVNGSQSIVQIDAAGADNIFQFDHRAVQLDQLKVYRPDGTEGAKPEGITSRFRSTFDLKLDAPGTWKIATSIVMVNGTAMVGGVERRVTTMRMGPRPGGPGGPGMGGPGGPGGGEGRRPEGGPPPGGPGGPDAGPPRQPPIQLAELPADATELKLAEIVNRTEAFVTVGSPTTQAFGGDPRGLTLQPITNPTDLVSNEPARFKLLIDGAPAAKIKVDLIPGNQRFRDGEQAIALTTDAQGVVTIKWPAPGYYLLTATAEDAKTSEKRASVRRLSYSATLEVAAP